MTRYMLAALAITGYWVSAARALPPSPQQTLREATETLEELATIPNKGIPTALLSEAHGVAIIPRVIKAGFVFGGCGGHGLVLAKDKAGNWGEPVFINIGGASVGLQAGVESTDVVLVFRSRKSLDRLFEGKGKITLGVDAAVAAGPVGRTAAAATDAKLQAEIMSYSRSRGLFAGVSLDGAAIHADANSNAQYRRDVSPMDRKLADGLRAKLVELSGPPPVVEIRPGQPAPPVIYPPVSPLPPRVPPVPMPPMPVPPGVPPTVPVPPGVPPTVPTQP
ncbi:lipid-binding SYLF domain-containing protein [Fimbriiglobus ruber]|uniref:Ysc84 actin-binding domain-containing protein n=1 Tax=Fimbriiglobus ruber TaxID=1908690 RepID=A0A225DPR3_9BACT|nr:lipid-binding SYLF domain-containing protein [Fimbriiglobus ruber]OWK40588.1 hypothetical protein FRUB_05507 [Fimbriiglobus ruber]